MGRVSGSSCLAPLWDSVQLNQLIMAGDDMNEEMRKADEYLKKHRIMELFNDLCASVCFQKPQDVRAFLLQELQTRENEGAECSFFEDAEVDAVFNLADLMGTGVVSDT